MSELVCYACSKKLEWGYGIKVKQYVVCSLDCFRTKFDFKTLRLLFK